MLTPLCVTSSYSFHFGTAAPAALAARARELGYRALALTDRNGVYGLPSFIEACEAEGIRPILGAEIVYEGGRALLLAKDKAGFARLSRLLTDRAAGGLDAREAVLRGLGCHEGLALASDDLALITGLCGVPDSFALLSPCNRPLWRRLRRSGLPCLAAGEARFLEAEDRDLQRLLAAIGANKTVDEVGEAELSPPGALLLAPSALAAAYADCPEALAANEELSPRLALSSLFDGYIFPRYGAPGSANSSEDAAALLRRLVYEGALRRYGSAAGGVGKRIEYELGVIEEKGFCDYFLVVRDIVRKASRSCGRGSAAASVVSYALGITDVDPIRHNLYFERFLNPGRIDPPDIDVDFAWDERDALLASVIEDYGESRAARVSNHVCFQSRSALRETARAYGMPEGEIAGIEREPAAATDETWGEIARLAPRLVGLPRHLGVHSGGLILAPDPLADHVPLERTGAGIRVTVWDKEGVDAAGLVKIDLLGNRSLAVVRDALANLAENGIELDEDSWRPIDDEETVKLLARGDTMGVFYVESPAMRLLQQKTGRGDFEHLVIHSSIIRPAANRYINEYIDRLNGKPYRDLHPLLAGLMDESFGIMCYQEDVSKAAIALAGFSAAEADGIRKALGKKNSKERLDAYKPKFYEGARTKGVAAETIDEIWAMIESFSGYSFVKAHSASYAMLSFRSAYLRRHHPAEFMAAVISNRGGFYTTLAYASESRRMGLTLLPPSVNESELRCRGKELTLRFGLELIGGLNSATARELVAERQRSGLFASIDALARRLRMERSDAEALAGSGALDELSPELSRAEKLMRLLAAGASRESQKSRELELFPDAPAALSRRSTRRDAERRRLESEMRYLGTTLAVHPLALYPRALALPRALGKELPALVGRFVDLVGWPITAKPVLTAGEEPMEFVSFEDETALFETVLFPDSFRRFRHLLFEERPLLIHGRVEKDRGAITVTIEGLEGIP